MNLPWTARPYNPIISMEGGVAYEKIHIENIDFDNLIFYYFSDKSKLVAHSRQNVATN